MPVLASRAVRPHTAKNVLFLHGAMGRGQNWRGTASRFCDAQPGWGARVADLRNHGASQGFGAPHSLQAGAQDILRLVAALADRGEPVDALVGHSLGGRLALEAVLLAQSSGWGGLAVSDARPLRLVLVDTSPGSLPPSADVHDVLAFAERLPPAIEGDWRTVKQLFLAEGFSDMLASWIATSVRRDGPGTVSLMFDPVTIRCMLEEYASPQADAWERAMHLPGWAHLTLVVGDKGQRWHSAKTQHRLERLGACERVTVCRLRTGHWVHVEDPDGTIGALRTAVSSAEALSRR